MAAPAQAATFASSQQGLVMQTTGDDVQPMPDAEESCLHYIKSRPDGSDLLPGFDMICGANYSSPSFLPAFSALCALI